MNKSDKLPKRPEQPVGAKILQFPNKTFVRNQTSARVKDVLSDENIPQSILNDFFNQGLNLFSSSLFPSDIHLLVDNSYELTKLNKRDSFTIDGSANIRSLLQSPTNNPELIKARKIIFETINKLGVKVYEELYSTLVKAKRIYAFDNTFDHFSDLRYIIEELDSYKKRNKTDYSDARSSMFFALCDAFGSGIGALEDARNVIPRHIQIIRNIPNSFFQKVADELAEAFEKAKTFDLEELRRIYKEKDREAFANLRNNLREFTTVFSHWDGILIVAKWINNGYLKSSQIIDNEADEFVTNLTDVRTLIVGDKEGYINHIPNNPPLGKQLEVYCGGNGSGKSTWLKTRLMLQLFHQVYGYVPADNAKLIIRNQIVFVNRGGSGYGEDLSAFGNDIKRKLLKFISNIKNGSLVFMDEFGSTIPEDEAYCLIRAVEDFLFSHNAKVLMSTHNERYIRFMNESVSDERGIYHFDYRCDKKGLPIFSYNIKKGRDNSHTLDIFRAAGMPEGILNNATGAILGKLGTNPMGKIQFKAIGEYSPEEREQLKSKIGGFDLITRYNDIILEKDNMSPGYFSPTLKYRRLRYEDNLLPGRPSQDLFSNSGNFRELDKDGVIPDFDLIVHSDDSKIIDPECLRPYPYNDDVFDRTYEGLSTWGLTSNIRKLKEKQRMFELIGDSSISEIISDANYFLWFSKYFPKNCENTDFPQMQKFNVYFSDLFFDNFEHYLNNYPANTIFNWFKCLIEIEELCGNLPVDFRDKNKQFFEKVEGVLGWAKRSEKLAKIYRDFDRDAIKKFEQKFAEAEQKNTREINTIIDSVGSNLLEELKMVFDQIKKRDIDYFTLSPEQRFELANIIDSRELFKYPMGIGERTHAINSSEGIMKIIKGLKSNGNYRNRIINILRKMDSTYIQSLANNMEKVVAEPDYEEVWNLVKLRVENPKRFQKESRNFYFSEDISCTYLMELNGIVDVAVRIKKQGWTKVEYNNTGEINIRQMTHPGLKMKKGKQVKNDFYLATNESFEVLEGATMGGKTFNIQSVYWIIRLAHSIGYVPAEFASMPVFDGIFYIDRILEKEKENLSAGQNDAKVWSDIIKNIREKIKEKSGEGLYWFAIDEMISSVPARFQKGLVVAILDELKQLGQKGQISIHNPDLVSTLVKSDTEAFRIVHPQVDFDTQGNFLYTHKIVPGRSIDRDGFFSAYSIETAEKMGLPESIIAGTRKYRKEIFSS